MSRFARKADRNQPEIVQALRQVGAEVRHIHRLPKMLDVIVGYRGQLFWAELKCDNEPLTEDERELIEAYKRVGVDLPVWRSTDEALRGIGAIS